MIDDDEILDIFREADDAFLSVAEVAEVLGYSQHGTAKRLDALAEADALGKKTAAGARIYWLPSRVS